MGRKRLWAKRSEFRASMVKEHGGQVRYASSMGMRAVMDEKALKKLRRLLVRLPLDVEKKIIKKAMREGWKPVAQAMRKNVRRVVGVVTGRLHRSIRKREVAYKGTGTFVVVGGPRYPEAAHAHLIEFGTDKRYRHGAFLGYSYSPVDTPKTGRGLTLFGRRYYRKRRIYKKVGYTGKGPERPFARPAWYSAGHRAMEIAEAEIWKGIKAATSGAKV